MADWLHTLEIGVLLCIWYGSMTVLTIEIYLCLIDLALGCCRVVVISSGHPPSVLTKVNSVIRRIDLTCKLLAPVLSGFIISFISMQASAVALALWNIVSVWLQYWLFVSVYNGIPALSKNSKLRRDTAAAVVLPSEIVGPAVVEGQRSRYSHMVLGWRVRLVKQLSVIICWDSWVMYMKQEVMLPGVSLAFLYFTVLR